MQNPQLPQQRLGKSLLWLIWLGYIGYLLLSNFPPGNSLLNIDQATLIEIWDLSLNFWFVLPTFSPNIAPVIHPALEGLFNLVIAWGLLFWGFLIDQRGQKFPLLPFLIGTALLTNVFFLPWLALRQPNPHPPETPLTSLEKISESRGLPLILSLIALLSFGWAIWARPEFGNIVTRWQELLTIIQSDRLAYSFVVDLLCFWLFQSWLVKDDMARRQWDNPGVLWLTRLLPFFGLVYYLLRRPRLNLESTQNIQRQ